MFGASVVEVSVLSKGLVLIHQTIPVADSKQTHLVANLLVITSNFENLLIERRNDLAILTDFVLKCTVLCLHLLPPLLGLVYT